jgi:hypothetical protein
MGKLKGGFGGMVLMGECLTKERERGRQGRMEELQFESVESTLEYPTRVSLIERNPSAVLLPNQHKNLFEISSKQVSFSVFQIHRFKLNNNLQLPL